VGWRPVAVHDEGVAGLAHGGVAARERKRQRKRRRQIQRQRKRQTETETDECGVWGADYEFGVWGVGSGVETRCGS